MMSCKVEADLLSGILWVTGFLRDSHETGVNFSIHHVTVTGQIKSTGVGGMGIITAIGQFLYEKYKYAN